MVDLSDVRTVKNINFNLCESNKMNISNSNLEEDHAESVDSGCVSDEPLPEIITTDKVPQSIMNEYNFSLNLLQHIPTVDTSPKKENDIITYETKACESKDIASDEPSTSCDDPIREKMELERELRLIRKKGNLSKIQRKIGEKKILKKIKILQNQDKKIKKNEKKGMKSELAVKLGLANNLAQANKIYNKCGKLVYSKFDFSNSKKERWTENKSKLDLNSYLSKLLKEKEKMNRFQEDGKVEKAANFYQSTAWKHAMDKVEGKKVKDDINKLKKSLSKQKKQKERTKANWEERKMKVDKAKEQRQEKRKMNIQKRKDQKTTKSKSKKSKGKKNKRKNGRIPGF